MRPNQLNKIDRIIKWISKILHKRFPLDVNNPLRYMMAVIIQYVLVLNTISFGACLITFMIGAHTMFLSLAFDIKSVIAFIIDNSATKKTRPKANFKLPELIELHVNALKFSWIFLNLQINVHNVHIMFLLRLVNCFSKIYQPFFVLIMSWSAAALCGSFLMLQMEFVSYLNESIKINDMAIISNNIFLKYRRRVFQKQWSLLAKWFRRSFLFWFFAKSVKKLPTYLLKSIMKSSKSNGICSRLKREEYS